MLTPSSPHTFSPHASRPLLSVPQLTAVVRAAPMPLHIKEQILDAALGCHDDLHSPEKPGPKTQTPKAVRVAEARRVGAFDFERRLPSGDEVWTYCKSGEPAYDLVTREREFVHCTCPNFRFESARDPEYVCKHGALWTQQETADALIFASARAAAAWETAWAFRKLGRITEAEWEDAKAAFQAARDAMRKVVCP